MWVYIESERFRDDNGEIHILWTVGFYDPEGKFQPESDHSLHADAVARVHYLNGGKSKEEIKKILMEIECEKMAEDALAQQSGYEALGFDGGQ